MGCVNEAGETIPCWIDDPDSPIGIIKNPDSYTQPFIEYNRYLDDGTQREFDFSLAGGYGVYMEEGVNVEVFDDPTNLLYEGASYSFGQGYGTMSKTGYMGETRLPGLPDPAVNPALYEYAWKQAEDSMLDQYKYGLNPDQYEEDFGIPIDEATWAGYEVFTNQDMAQDALNDFYEARDAMLGAHSQQYADYINSGGTPLPLSELQVEYLQDFDSSAVETHYRNLKYDDQYAQAAYEINLRENMRKELYDQYAPTLAKAMYIWDQDKNPNNQGTFDHGKYEGARYVDVYFMQNGITGPDTVPGHLIGLGANGEPLTANVWLGASYYQKALFNIDRWIDGERMDTTGGLYDPKSWQVLPAEFYPDKELDFTTYLSQFDADAQDQWDEFMQKVDEQVGGGGGNKALLGKAVRNVTEDEAKKAMDALKRYQENPDANPDVALDIASGGMTADFAQAAQSQTGLQQIMSGGILAENNRPQNFGQKPTPIQGYVSAGLGSQSSVGMYGSNTGNVLRAAEGGLLQGEQLVSPADTNMSGLDEDESLALLDVLGQNKYRQLESAMADYPVVEEVADMAVYQATGPVQGKGTSKSDSVPARLSDGEFVFAKEAVDAIGQDALLALHDKAKRAVA